MFGILNDCEIIREGRQLTTQSGERSDPQNESANLKREVVDYSIV